MGLLKRVARFTRRKTPHTPRIASSAEQVDVYRRCLCEPLEDRQLLAADIQVGAVYYEEASGADKAGDLIEITFQGGQPGTQLSQIAIETDKLGDGLTIGDVFFDTAAGGAGAFDASPPIIITQDGIDAIQVLVDDGGTTLTLDFQGFDPGDRLLLSIDVDEQGFLGANAVAEGNEFEGSILTATFRAPHFFDATGADIFIDGFDSKLAASGLDLPNDDYVPPDATPHPVRTAGAFLALAQEPLPISLSGTVYEDLDLDNQLEPGEPGIGNVDLELFAFDGSNYVSTGKTTTTDSAGNYRFDDLAPGTYRVVETQPSGWLSVGATAGTVDGTTRGVVSSPDVISEVTLLGGEDSVDNDFAETRPASLAGNVYHDRDNDGQRDTGEEGIGGVTIEVQRIVDNGPLPPAITVQTAADGSWVAAGLEPGKYTVREIHPSAYLDGLDTAGSAGGVAQNPGDQISGIMLAGGQNGVEYNFGELLPGSIHGRVHGDTDGDCELDPGESPIEGVTVYLLNANGDRIDSTTTNADGEYWFTGLAPGVYGIEEEQPAGYFQGGQRVGSAGGTVAGTDLIREIEIGSGQEAVEYNFCEHPPAAIWGNVYADDNNNGLFDAGESGIGGVTVSLLDANGVPTGLTAVTDADGAYHFEGLEPGTYGVAEQQPAGFFDGLDTAGTAGGVAENPGDRITQVVLAPGAMGANYNFGELRPASIRGRVHSDLDEDCELDPGESPIEGVTVYLLNANGDRIASTTTDAQGEYVFDNLAPGTYGVEEMQPDGFFQGGQVVGSAGGLSIVQDRITNIVLTPGTDAVDYNFCEHPPASIAGNVYADDNDNGVFDTGESGIGGVTLSLLDASGQPTGQTTVTAADGSYRFDNLEPGTYGVSELQPAGFFDGRDAAGSAGGVAENPGDRITGALLGAGVAAVNYDFGELRPASIHGRVHSDLDEDCELDPGESPIEGVTIYLLNANGDQIASTTTDANGEYWFTDLVPGTYGVQEVQPDGFFQGGESVGTHGGVVTADDLIQQIELAPGSVAEEYNFCEQPPATISGFVFQDGPPIVVDSLASFTPEQVKAFRDGQRTGDDVPLAGVTLRLGNFSGEPVLDAFGQEITTVTDANGFYQFTNLPPGVYTVLEVHPEGYVDGIDTAGTTGGTPFNAGDPISPQLLSVDHRFDAIARIPVGIGQQSANNNFSEVLLTEAPEPPVTDPPGYFDTPGPTLPSAPAPVLFPIKAPIAPLLAPAVVITRPTLYIDGGSGVLGTYTWHLSVIDAGNPRGPRYGYDPLVQTSGRLNWHHGELASGQWDLYSELGEHVEQQQHEARRHVVFGVEGGIPVTGDWDGDGKTDVGVYREGEWFLDLNGNGFWDDNDLWAQLGSKGDLPVTGDWNGDGKTDIGIFGPEWPGDPRALAAEPGLPDPDNMVLGREKNLPPRPEEATMGTRKLRLTSRSRVREDLIDHVFHYGTPGDRPLTGDWNGDGTDSIGVFREGNWFLDVNGNGRWDHGDRAIRFGKAGDLPVVGDFDGDGIDELGVFRNGVFYLDMNADQVIDAHDKVLEIGSAGDRPVVGDWDGDGVEDVGVYRESNVPQPAMPAANDTASTDG